MTIKMSYLSDALPSDSSTIALATVEALAKGGACLPRRLVRRSLGVGGSETKAGVLDCSGCDAAFPALLWKYNASALIVKRPKITKQSQIKKHNPLPINDKRKNRLA
jgi:hypothetical protein